MRDVLFIPGIGGHPLFHRQLIVGLQDRFNIHTAPHGDFSSTPYKALESHVDHWIGRASEVGGNDLGLVAVSFGAHVVPGLMRRYHHRFSRVVLISPWIQGRLMRTLIRASTMLPEQICASLLSRMLMHWSDRHADHAEEIQRYRAELYDDHASVAARWQRRMLAIGNGGALTWTVLHGLGGQRRLTLLFGREEWLWKLQKRRLARMVRDDAGLLVHALSGGHEIGTFSTGETIAQVTAALS